MLSSVVIVLLHGSGKTRPHSALLTANTRSFKKVAVWRAYFFIPHDLHNGYRIVVMELGGNIELIGFLEVDQNDLVIVKKLVGTYTKDLAGAREDFERLSVTLTQESPYTLVAAAVVGQDTFSSQQSDKNLHFALDAALKDVLSHAGV